jgi:hypothetical protein
MPFATIAQTFIFPHGPGQHLGPERIAAFQFQEAQDQMGVAMANLQVGFYKVEDRGPTRDLYTARIMYPDNSIDPFAPLHAQGDLVAYDLGAAGDPWPTISNPTQTSRSPFAKNLQPATAIPVFTRGRFQGYSHVLTNSLSAETLANIARAREAWGV